MKITRHGQEQEVERRRPNLPVSDGGGDGGVLIDGSGAKVSLASDSHLAAPEKCLLTPHPTPPTPINPPELPDSRGAVRTAVEKIDFV